MKEKTPEELALEALPLTPGSTDIREFTHLSWRLRWLLVRIVLICARKAWKTFTGAYARDNDPSNDDKMKHLEHAGGFLHPAMLHEWDKVFDVNKREIEDDGSREGDTHYLTNVLVEWNRLDAQRGAKFMAFAIVSGWGLAGVSLLVVIGLTIVLIG